MDSRSRPLSARDQHSRHLCRRRCSLQLRKTMRLRRRGRLHRNSVCASVSGNAVKGNETKLSMSNQTEIVQNQQVDEALFAKMRQAPILSSLKDDEIRCLKGVEEICLDPGGILARQGETAHYFWILMEGEMGLYQASPESEEYMISSIPSGFTFGEVPLLANIPNAATLRAIS